MAAVVVAVAVMMVVVVVTAGVRRAVVVGVGCAVAGSSRVVSRRFCTARRSSQQSVSDINQLAVLLQNSALLDLPLGGQYGV